MSYPMPPWMYGPPPPYGPPYGPPPSQEDPSNLIPPVVRTAVAVLNLFTEKTSSKIAVNGVGFQDFDGQKLTPVEENTQSAACNLLIQYFQRNVLHGREDDPSEGGYNKPGRILPCFACHPHPPRKECTVCQGFGVIYILPLPLERKQS